MLEIKMVPDVVYFDQRMHACTYVRMVKNDWTWKSSQKYLFTEYEVKFNNSITELGHTYRAPDANFCVEIKKEEHGQI